MKTRPFVFLLVLFFGSTVHAALPSHTTTVQRIETYLADQDYLGARVLLKRLSADPVRYEDWQRVRMRIFQTPQIGEDVLLAWDKKKPVSSPKKTPLSLEKSLKQADDALLKRDFSQALSHYTKMAQWLKPRLNAEPSTLGQNARVIYPYVLHGMARALFGEKRFLEAHEVYSWITPDYPRFRQTLFEKMWAAFKAGRAELALGAIASQRSAYFTRFLDPESYLVLIYLYKTLCRQDDLKQVVQEITELKDSLTQGKLNAEEWAKNEIQTRVFLNLLSAPSTPSDEWVSASDRKAEALKVKDLLERLFKFHKQKLLARIPLIHAYSQLAATPGVQSGLRPIEKIKSREALLKSNLELWPAEDSEHWLDELGHERFLGESQCALK